MQQSAAHDLGGRGNATRIDLKIAAHRRAEVGAARTDNFQAACADYSAICGSAIFNFQYGRLADCYPSRGAAKLQYRVRAYCCRALQASGKVERAAPGNRNCTCDIAVDCVTAGSGYGDSHGAGTGANCVAVVTVYLNGICARASSDGATAIAIYFYGRCGGADDRDIVVSVSATDSIDRSGCIGAGADLKSLCLIPIKKNAR